MPARPLPALLAFVLLACSRAEPAPPVVPEPVPIPAEAPSAPGGMAPPPPATASAEPAATEAPEPYEPSVDPGTVELPPLDKATRDALAAFVTLQRSIATENGAEVHGPNDRFDVVVGPKARTVLPALKRAAREAARRVLGVAPTEGAAGHSPTGHWLSAFVTRAFADAGAAVSLLGSNKPLQTIGAVWGIDVTHPAGHPDKLGLVITLSLPCGSDGSFYVLEEQRQGAPRVLMAVEANGYNSITDGQLALTAKLSPPDARGGWYAVVAHSHPWCSSAWRGIDYRVFVPSADAPDAPRRVLEDADSAYLGMDLCTIEAGADHFAVHYTAWGRFTDDVTRPYVHGYERRNGAFVRVQPLVARTVDLPAEWARMPWAEAQRFVAGPSAAALQPWHKVLARADRELDGKITVEREDEATGEARLSLTCDKCTTFSGRLLIDVKRDEAGWAMAGVSRAP